MRFLVAILLVVCLSGTVEAQRPFCPQSRYYGSNFAPVFAPPYQPYYPVPAYYNPYTPAYPTYPSYGYNYWYRW